MTATTVITDNGVAAASIADADGLLIQIAEVQIGANLITPNAGMTGVSGVVFTGAASSYVSYDTQNGNLMVFTVTLDGSVGPFVVGNVGLFLADGTMFTITGLDQQFQKNPAVSGQDLGTEFAVAVVVAVSNIASLMDVSVLTPTIGSVPSVGARANLPPYNVAPYSLYRIVTDEVSGDSTLAVKGNSGWLFLTPS